MAALPLDVATGIVAGRLTRAAAPGTIGEPIPNARVTLTPEFGIAAAPHASPPVLILPDPVRCTTDETGLLLDERGNPGVELVATDAPGLEPAAWTWRVVVHSPATGAQRWSILVPAGQTTDLSTAVHVPSNTGQAILEWRAVRDDALAARDDALQAKAQAVAAQEAARADAIAALAATEVEQITLTGNLALTIPEGHPAGQVYRCAITQTTGGHTVTYGPDTLAIDTDPGASTLVEIWPGGEVTYPGAVVSGGVTDHGALTGLGDDDHTQYHTDARGDARYSALGHGHTLDAVTDTATRVAMTPAERTKLTGVATGATANATDAQLRDRSTHTGTQTSATLSDLTEVVQDIVGALIVAGTNTTVSYNDAAGTFTINSTAVGGSTDPEVVRDTIGGALVPGSGIQITVNDAGDTITIASTAVLPTRQVVAGTGLTGGGDLSADRTLSVSYGTTAGSAAQGNDSRFHTHPAVIAQGATQEEARAAIDAVTPADVRVAGDARYIRTVNGTGPDGNGNVAVSGGGGGLGPQPISVMLPPIGQYLPLRALGVHAGAQTVSSTMKTSTTSVSLTAIEVVGGCTVDRWGVYLSTPATDAGAVLKAALYRSDLTLVRGLGEVGITGAAGLRECDISQLALTPGVYFIALQVSAQTTSGTNPTFYGTVTGLIGSRSILNSNNHFGYVSGPQEALSSWPESLSITHYSSTAAPNMVRVSMRRSS